MVKLADFGLSRSFDDGKDHYVMRQGARLPMKWTDPGGYDPPTPPRGARGGVMRLLRLSLLSGLFFAAPLYLTGSSPPTVLCLIPFSG
jgi:hypothetical protein